MCPPATKSCPSERSVCPAQKMFAPAFTSAVFAPVAGSQRVGLSPLANEGHHITVPDGSRAAWTALYGQVVLADHWPTVAGSCATALEARINESRKMNPSQNGRRLIAR